MGATNHPAHAGNAGLEMANGEGWIVFGLAAMVTFVALGAHDGAVVSQQEFIEIKCGPQTPLNRDSQCLQPDKVGMDTFVRVNARAQTVQVWSEDKKWVNQPIIMNTCKVVDGDNWTCNSPDDTWRLGMENGRYFSASADQSQYSSSLTGLVGWAFSHRLMSFQHALWLSGAPQWASSPATPILPVAAAGRPFSLGSLFNWYQGWAWWVLGPILAIGILQPIWRVFRNEHREAKQAADAAPKSR